MNVTGSDYTILYVIGSIVRIDVLPTIAELIPIYLICPKATFLRYSQYLKSAKY
jgi:hypothetical protein